MISLRRILFDEVVRFQVKGEDRSFVDMPTLWAHEITNVGSWFGLQTILRNFVPRNRDDIRDIGWVTYQIFPGGITPRMEDIVQAVNPYWEVVEAKTRREDYGKTCWHWPIGCGRTRR
jgi:cyclopropane fatty-acyl-phospholipid synthase-like methyltransferase